MAPQFPQPLGPSPESHHPHVQGLSRVGESSTHINFVSEHRVNTVVSFRLNWEAAPLWLGWQKEGRVKQSQKCPENKS